MNRQEALFPKKILLGLQEGSCNLKCPKCYTHGSNIISDNYRPSMVMDFKSFQALLDEMVIFKPRVTPQTWDEPLLTPRIFDYLEEMKKRDLVVTMDTNGLLLNAEKMKNLVELKMDSIFISIDAITKETYSIVRGVDRLSFLTDIVLQFLAIRGNSLFPRIGVSFVEELENTHEVESFASYWSKYVDVVRINKMFKNDRSIGTAEVKTIQRKPCWSLYDSLMIHPNGEAALCCVDTHFQNKIGNVFKNGISDVWNGAFFNMARLLHERGEFSKISVCAKCELWANGVTRSKELEEVVMTQSYTHTYYNRKDRMGNLKDNRFYTQGLQSERS